MIDSPQLCVRTGARFHLALCRINRLQRSHWEREPRSRGITFAEMNAPCARFVSSVCVIKRHELVHDHLTSWRAHITGA